MTRKVLESPHLVSTHAMADVKRKLGNDKPETLERSVSQKGTLTCPLPPPHNSQGSLKGS